MRFYAKRLRVGAASDFADVLHRAAQDDRILRACDVDIGKIRVIGTLGSDPQLGGKIGLEKCN